MLSTGLIEMERATEKEREKSAATKNQLEKKTHFMRVLNLSFSITNVIVGRSQNQSRIEFNIQCCLWVARTVSLVRIQKSMQNEVMNLVKYLHISWMDGKSGFSSPYLDSIFPKINVALEN